MTGFAQDDTGQGWSEGEASPFQKPHGPIDKLDLNLYYDAQVYSLLYFPLVAKGVDDEDPSTFKHFLIVDDFLDVMPLRAKTFYF
jgi:hypothetical protein